MKSELLAEYYTAADLFVLPTREDIWGLVINEAMSYGLPVITTGKCVAGIELLVDKVNCIVPADNVQLLQAAIRNLISNEHELMRISQNNFKTINRYCIDNMAYEHILIFNRK